jgi:cobalamin biosynthesis protein CobT
MIFNTSTILTEAKKAVIKPGKKLGNTDYTVGSDEEPDDGTQDTATDYTDEETDADPTDTPDTEGDNTDTTDDTDDSGATDYTNTPDDTDNTDDTTADSTADEPDANPDDENKKLALLTDFISFYRNIKDIIDKIADIKKTNLMLASVLNQVNKNLSILEENVFQFVSRVFPSKKYVENLYQYNCFIEAFKINIEMLKKIKYLDIG